MAELGMTNLAVTRGFDHGPGLGIGEQSLEHQRVQAMATAMGAIGAEDRSACQSEIANRVKRLVAHEFVRITQPFAVDDAVIANGDGVVERGAEGKTGSPKPLDIHTEDDSRAPGGSSAERE